MIDYGPNPTFLFIESHQIKRGTIIQPYKKGVKTKKGKKGVKSTFDSCDSVALPHPSFMKGTRTFRIQKPEARGVHLEKLPFGNPRIP
jgi:hypothetical protein